MKRLGMLIAVGLIVGSMQFASGETRQDAPQLSKHDQLKIGVQAICPISGNKLGEHGEPIKVKIGEEHIFVCCQGCLKGEIDPQHWQTIHANFAKAQAKCPVMEKPLPKKPKWTVVEGQIVYICCPPCSEKIQADPAKFLAEVDTAYEAYLKAQQ